MTWTATYNAEFTKPLIRQLLAIIQRDQRDALDWVGGEADLLPSIVSYQLAPLTVPQFPAVLVAPMQSLFVQEAVGSRQSANGIYCAVAVAHQDGQALAELVQDYVRALDAIFMSVPLPDFYTALPLTLPRFGGRVAGPVNPTPGSIETTPLAVGTVKELFVVSHNYDEIRRAKQGFMCAATLEIAIDREET